MVKKLKKFAGMKKQGKEKTGQKKKPACLKNRGGEAKTPKFWEIFAFTLYIVKVALIFSQSRAAAGIGRNIKKREKMADKRPPAVGRIAVNKPYKTGRNGRKTAGKSELTSGNKSSRKSKNAIVAG